MPGDIAINNCHNKSIINANILKINHLNIINFIIG